MANPRTLAQLQASVLARGQYEGSNDLDPAKNPSSPLTEFINEAIAEVYDLLVQKWADYYTVTGSPFTTVVGTFNYSLDTIAPSFYKLRKLEVLISGDASDPQARWRRLRPIDLEASHRFTQYGLIGKGYRYRLQAGNLVLTPPPTSVDTLRVFFIPYATRLVNAGDTFDGINNYEELVIQQALLYCKRREELPTDDIEREIARLTARVRTAADGRDAGDPFYLAAGGPSDGDDDDDAGVWW
jgi:hypothetical protein